MKRKAERLNKREEEWEKRERGGGERKEEWEERERGWEKGNIKKKYWQDDTVSGHEMLS